MRRETREAEHLGYFRDCILDSSRGGVLPWGMSEKRQQSWRRLRRMIRRVMTRPAFWIGLVLLILGLPGSLDDAEAWRVWLKVFGDPDVVLLVTRVLGGTVFGGVVVWGLKDAWGWTLPRSWRRRLELELREASENLPGAVSHPSTASPSDPKPIYWSRLDWTRVFTTTGLTEAVYRRLHPDEAYPIVRLMDNDHERRVIEDKLLDDFNTDTADVEFEDRDELLGTLRSWARKRAYQEMLKRKDRQ